MCRCVSVSVVVVVVAGSIAVAARCCDCPFQQSPFVLCLGPGFALVLVVVVLVLFVLFVLGLAAFGTLPIAETALVHRVGSPTNAHRTQKWRTLPI